MILRIMILNIKTFIIITFGIMTIIKMTQHDGIIIWHDDLA